MVGFEATPQLMRDHFPFLFRPMNSIPVVPRIVGRRLCRLVCGLALALTYLPGAVAQVALSAWPGGLLGFDRYGEAVRGPARSGPPRGFPWRTRSGDGERCCQCLSTRWVGRRGVGLLGGAATRVGEYGRSCQVCASVPSEQRVDWRGWAFGPGLGANTPEPSGVFTSIVIGRNFR